MLTREQATAKILEAKRNQKLTWSSLLRASGVTRSGQPRRSSGSIPCHRKKPNRR